MRSGHSRVIIYLSLDSSVFLSFFFYNFPFKYDNQPARNSRNWFLAVAEINSNNISKFRIRATEQPFFHPFFHDLTLNTRQSELACNSRSWLAAVAEIYSNNISQFLGQRNRTTFLPLSFDGRRNKTRQSLKITGRRVPRGIRTAMGHGEPIREGRK